MFGLVAIGCRGITTVEPTTENEVRVLAETDRLAGVLGVKVRGEITDYVLERSNAECGIGVAHCIAAAWYERGVCYYYRPEINRYSLEFMTDLAAHEVCHSKHFFHDHKHWQCMVDLGAIPTYPEP